MAELKITLEFRLSQKVARWGLSALLLALCAPELASESVTLTTYYPAPSGVYAQMITTSNTYLARDGGDVGVGTSSPTHKLDVIGDGHFSTNLDVDGNLTVGGTATFNDLAIKNAISWNNNRDQLNTDQGGSIELGGTNSAANPVSNGAPYIDFHFGTGGVQDFNARIANEANSRLGFYTNSGGEVMYLAGDNAYFTAAAEASGVIVAKSYGGGGCSGSPATYSAGVTNCPAGTYATMVSGLMTKYQLISASLDPAGEMLCCSCPAGGCPAF